MPGLFQVLDFSGKTCLVLLAHLWVFRHSAMGYLSTEKDRKRREDIGNMSIYKRLKQKKTLTVSSPWPCMAISLIVLKSRLEVRKICSYKCRENWNKLPRKLMKYFLGKFLWNRNICQRWFSYIYSTSLQSNKLDARRSPSALPCLQIQIGIEDTSSPGHSSQQHCIWLCNGFNYSRKTLLPVFSKRQASEICQWNKAWKRAFHLG